MDRSNTGMAEPLTGSRPLPPRRRKRQVPGAWMLFSAYVGAVLLALARYVLTGALLPGVHLAVAMMTSTTIETLAYGEWIKMLVSAAISVGVVSAPTAGIYFLVAAKAVKPKWTGFLAGLTLSIASVVLAVVFVVSSVPSVSVAYSADPAAVSMAYTNPIQVFKNIIEHAEFTCDTLQANSGGMREVVQTIGYAVYTLPLMLIGVYILLQEVVTGRRLAAQTRAAASGDRLSESILDAGTEVPPSFSIGDDEVFQGQTATDFNYEDTIALSTLEQSMSAQDHFINNLVIVQMSITLHVVGDAFFVNLPKHAEAFCFKDLLLVNMGVTLVLAAPMALTALVPLHCKRGPSVWFNLLNVIGFMILMVKRGFDAGGAVVSFHKHSFNSAKSQLPALYIIVALSLLLWILEGCWLLFAVITHIIRGRVARPLAPLSDF